MKESQCQPSPWTLLEPVDASSSVVPDACQVDCERIIGICDAEIEWDRVKTFIPSRHWSGTAAAKARGHAKPVDGPVVKRANNTRTPQTRQHLRGLVEQDGSLNPAPINCQRCRPLRFNPGRRCRPLQLTSPLIPGGVDRPETLEAEREQTKNQENSKLHGGVDEWADQALEEAVSRQSGLPWDMRGPTPPQPSVTSDIANPRWRGQKWRAGSARYANPGGKDKEKWQAWAYFGKDGWMHPRSSTGYQEFYV